MITVNVLEATANTAELEVLSTEATETYASITAKLEAWLADQGSTWTVDADMARVGVGITADGKGAGHSARFFASISN